MVIAGFQRDQLIGIVGHICGDHRPQNFRISDAILAVQLGVESPFTANPFGVEEDGGTLGSRWGVAKMFDDNQRWRPLAIVELNGGGGFSIADSSYPAS